MPVSGLPDLLYSDHGSDFTSARLEGLEHPFGHSAGRTELLIIDEADRLKATGLEQVRDYFDRHHMGVILIGTPGVETDSPAIPSFTAASASPTSTGP